MNTYTASIEHAKRLIRKIDDPAHDIDHAAEVVDNGRLISIAESYDDVSFIELCCWWHDVARDQADHEETGARMLQRDLVQRGVARDTAQRAYEAIHLHKWTMQPKTVEGKILKDADKLTFISINRWRKCIAADRLEHMRPIIPLLADLRKALYFESSREIHDERIADFRAYLGGLPASVSLVLR